MYKLLLLLFLFPICINAQSPEEKLNEYCALSNNQMVYVHTSQTFYEPGSTVFGTVWLFGADDKSISSKCNYLVLDVYDPSSKLIESIHINIFRGSAAFNFNLPDISGIYSLKVHSVDETLFLGNQVYQKTIQVQQIKYSSMLVSAVSDKTLYKPGDTAALLIKVSSLLSEGVDACDVMCTLYLDGKADVSTHAVSDESGYARIRIA